MTVWRRVLVYLGLADPPPGTVTTRVSPWWLSAVIGILLLGTSILELASGAQLWGVTQLFLAAVLLSGAWRPQPE